MADWPANGQPTAEQWSHLMERVSQAIADGFALGLKRSHLGQALGEQLQKMQARLYQMESQLKNMDDRAVRSLTETNAAGADPSPIQIRGAHQQQPVPADKPVGSGRPTTVLRRVTGSASAPLLVRNGEPVANQKEVQLCSEPGCDRPVRSRGLCAMHYQRVLTHEHQGKPRISNLSIGPARSALPRPVVTRKKNGGTQGIFALLYEERGRRLLAGLINQMKYNRLDMIKRINEQYPDKPGVPIEEEDLMRAVHYHKLGEHLRKREGEIILRYLKKQQGSLVKTAQHMKTELDELKRRIGELELEEEVSQLRHDYSQQIIEKATFSEKLDLALTREKYLSDLGIENQVDAALRAELDEQLQKLPDDADKQRAAEVIRDRLQLDEQRLRRLVRRYHLEERIGVEDETPV